MLFSLSLNSSKVLIWSSMLLMRNSLVLSRLISSSIEIICSRFWSFALMGDSCASISLFISSILELNLLFLCSPTVLRDSISCWNPIILELIAENILLKYWVLDISVATFNREFMFAIKESSPVKTLSKLAYSDLSSTYKCNFLGADNKQ